MKKLRVLFAAAVATVLACGSAHAVQYLKICSAAGPGYYYNPGTSTCLAADAGQKAEEGVAIDLALPGTTVDPGKVFGVSAHIGTFEGQNAIGVGAGFRAGNAVFDGGVGFGLGQHIVAGRVGVSFAW
jgi:hypothetical protein